MSAERRGNGRYTRALPMDASPQPPSHRTAYRHDIDGLRAVAVLAVLVHHLAPALLPGGFVGVDVFFVISGYLITGQILADRAAGSFSIGNFYRRRINRIVPALLLMTAASTLCGFVLLLPTDLMRLLLSGAAALGGVANVFFWTEYGSYFARPSGEAVLLHTWSLGVEEQFYLLWPWLLLLLARLRLRLMLASLIGLGGIALIGSELLAARYASAAFYLLPARAFELLLGALLATQPRSHGSSSRWLGPALGLSGIALLCWALLGLDGSQRFPGLHALPPCLGAALLIASGHHARPLRLLSLAPLVWLGKLSYSIYLWHWPAIAYLNYLDIPISPALGAGIALASVLLAWASWTWVEQPMRRSGMTLSVGQVLARRLLLPLGLFLVIALAGKQFAGFPARFDASTLALEAALSSRPDELRKGCHVPAYRYRDEPAEHCRLGAAKPEPDGLLVGDSFANHWSPMVDEMARHEGLALRDYTMDACVPLLRREPALTAEQERCDWRNRHVIELVRRHHHPLVLLAARWPTEPGAHLPELEAMVAALIDAGATPVIIQRNQSLGRKAMCPMRQAVLDLQRDCTVAQDELPRYWDALRQRYPQLHIVDANRFICAAGRCSALLDGAQAYRDGGHLNAAGSRQLGRLMVGAGERLDPRPAGGPETARR